MVKGILHFDDDSIEIIRNVQDFAKVICDRLGYEAEQMVQELIITTKNPQIETLSGGR